MLYGNAALSYLTGKSVKFSNIEKHKFKEHILKLSIPVIDNNLEFAASRISELL